MSDETDDQCPDDMSIGESELLEGSLVDVQIPTRQMDVEANPDLNVQTPRVERRDEPPALESESQIEPTDQSPAPVETRGEVVESTQPSSRDPSPAQVSLPQNYDDIQNQPTEDVRMLPAGGGALLGTLTFTDNIETLITNARMQAEVFVPMRIERGDAKNSAPPRQTIEPNLTCIPGDGIRRLPENEIRRQANDFYRLKTSQLPAELVPAMTAAYSRMTEHARPDAKILIAVTDENGEFTRDKAIFCELNQLANEILVGVHWGDVGALEPYPQKLGERLMERILGNLTREHIGSLSVRWPDYFRSIPLGRLPYIKVLYVGDSFSCAHTTLDIGTAYTLIVVLTGAYLEELVGVANIIAQEAPSLQTVVVSGGHNDVLKTTMRFNPKSGKSVPRNCSDQEFGDMIQNLVQVFQEADICDKNLVMFTPVASGMRGVGTKLVDAVYELDTCLDHLGLLNKQVNKPTNKKKFILKTNFVHEHDAQGLAHPWSLETLGIFVAQNRSLRRVLPDVNLLRAQPQDIASFQVFLMLKRMLNYVQLKECMKNVRHRVSNSPLQVSRMSPSPMEVGMLNGKSGHISNLGGRMKAMDEILNEAEAKNQPLVIPKPEIPKPLAMSPRCELAKYLTKFVPKLYEKLGFNVPKIEEFLNAPISDAARIMDFQYTVQGTTYGLVDLFSLNHLWHGYFCDSAGDKVDPLSITVMDLLLIYAILGAKNFAAGPKTLQGLKFTLIEDRFFASTLSAEASALIFPNYKFGGVGRNPEFKMWIAAWILQIFRQEGAITMYDAACRLGVTVEILRKLLGPHEWTVMLFGFRDQQPLVEPKELLLLEQDRVHPYRIATLQSNRGSCLEVAQLPPNVRPERVGFADDCEIGCNSWSMMRETFPVLMQSQRTALRTNRGIMHDLEKFERGHPKLCQVEVAKPGMDELTPAENHIPENLPPASAEHRAAVAVLFNLAVPTKMRRRADGEMNIFEDFNGINDDVIEEKVKYYEKIAGSAEDYPRGARKANPDSEMVRREECFALRKSTDARRAMYYPAARPSHAVVPSKKKTVSIASGSTATAISSKSSAPAPAVKPKHAPINYSTSSTPTTTPLPSPTIVTPGPIRCTPTPMAPPFVPTGLGTSKQFRPVQPLMGPINVTRSLVFRPSVPVSGAPALPTLQPTGSERIRGSVPMRHSIAMTGTSSKLVVPSAESPTGTSTHVTVKPVSPGRVPSKAPRLSIPGAPRSASVARSTSSSSSSVKEVPVSKSSENETANLREEINDLKKLVKDLVKKMEGTPAESAVPSTPTRTTVETTVEMGTEFLARIRDMPGKERRRILSEPAILTDSGFYYQGTAELSEARFVCAAHKIECAVLDHPTTPSVADCTLCDQQGGERELYMSQPSFRMKENTWEQMFDPQVTRPMDRVSEQVLPLVSPMFFERLNGEATAKPVFMVCPHWQVSPIEIDAISPGDVNLLLESLYPDMEESQHRLQTFCAVNQKFKHSVPLSVGILDLDRVETLDCHFKSPDGFQPCIASRPFNQRIAQQALLQLPQEMKKLFSAILSYQLVETDDSIRDQICRLQVELEKIDITLTGLLVGPGERVAHELRNPSAHHPYRITEILDTLTRQYERKRQPLIVYGAKDFLPLYMSEYPSKLVVIDLAHLLPTRLMVDYRDRFREFGIEAVFSDNEILRATHFCTYTPPSITELSAILCGSVSPELVLQEFRKYDAPSTGAERLYDLYRFYMGWYQKNFTQLVILTPYDASLMSIGGIIRSGTTFPVPSMSRVMMDYSRIHFQPPPEEVDGLMSDDIDYGTMTSAYQG